MIKKSHPYQYGSFFLFLLLSIVIWFVYRYEDVYVGTLKTNIVWENVPSHIVLESNEFQCPVKVKGTGYRLIFDALFEKQMTIDFNKVVQLNSHDAVVMESKLINQLQSNLHNGYEVIAVSSSSLQLPFYTLYQKKVPVLFQPKLEYLKGLSAQSPGFLSTDSVMLTGKKTLLDTITKIELQHDNIVVNDTLIESKIKVPEIDDTVHVDPSEITFRLSSTYYTQASITVQVRVKDVPSHVAVKVIPDKVVVNCLVPVKDYSLLNENLFDVYVAYNDLDSSENILAPKLEIFSENIKDCKTQVEQIKVLVIR